MEKDNYLRVIKQSDPNYMQILELSVTYGNPVLIENVGKYTVLSMFEVYIRYNIFLPEMSISMYYLNIQLKMFKKL